MKSIVILLWTLALLPLGSMAEDITLVDGTEYKDVTVSRIEPEGIAITTQDGVERIPFSKLPQEAQDTYRAIAAAQAKKDAALSPQPDKSQMAASQPTPELKPQAAAPVAITPDANAANHESPASLAETQKRRYINLAIYAGIFLLLSLVALAVVWFILHRLMSGWAFRQRQKEFEFGNVRDFHVAYSDFIAIWKLWNHCLEHNENDLPGDHGEYELPHAARWELLTRAYIAEGNIETTFLKLAAAHKLTPDEIEMLGRFRQGFQKLGAAIRSNKPLNWNDAEHPDFLVFNRLASCIATLIGGEDPGTQVLDRRADAFRQITSDRWNQRPVPPAETKVAARAAH